MEGTRSGSAEGSLARSEQTRKRTAPRQRYTPATPNHLSTPPRRMTDVDPSVGPVLDSHEQVWRPLGGLPREVRERVADDDQADDHRSRYPQRAATAPTPPSWTCAAGGAHYLVKQAARLQRIRQRGSWSESADSTRHGRCRAPRPPPANVRRTRAAPSGLPECDGLSVASTGRS